jgi:hypothetical protein
MYESRIVKNKIPYQETRKCRTLEEYNDNTGTGEVGRIIGLHNIDDSPIIHTHSDSEKGRNDINNNEVETMSEWIKKELKKAHDFKVESELVGTLIAVVPNEFVDNETGQKGMDFLIEKKGGEQVIAYGKSVLVTLLKDVTLKTEIKIVFKGMEKAKKSGRYYENFEVFTRE